jgi:magnesium chelatase family protein
MRPFRAPHHTASAHAIIGGGPRAQPGEVSLAHHGVLFLDEFPEFDRRVLEGLREPLEAGSVAVSRAAMQAVYPARFQLVAAMNPCPCGWHGEPNGGCHCAGARLARYRERLSGPLLDRIDLRVQMSGVTQEELLTKAPRSASTTAALAAEVAAARELQLRRAGRLNAFLDPRDIERWCELGADAERVIERSYARTPLSARAVHRVLRVARTLADLDQAPEIAVDHVAEAVGLRRALEYY